MKLELIDADQISLTQKFIKETVDFIQKELAKKEIISAQDNRKLIIAFITEESMTKLNTQFRNKAQVTDVLSFSPVDGEGLGELALCVPKVQEQAQEEGLTLEEETAYLILHGVLHLLGYHHEGGGEPARLMYQIQDDVFEKWRAHHKSS